MRTIYDERFHGVIDVTKPPYCKLYAGRKIQCGPSQIPLRILPSIPVRVPAVLVDAVIS